MLDWSLLRGWLLGVIDVFGILGACVLLFGRWRWVIIRVPIAAAVGVAAVVALNLFVDHIWHPFADHIPLTVSVWIGLATFGLALTGIGGKFKSKPRLWSRRWWIWRLIVGLGAASVLSSSAAQINHFYGEYPTLRSALQLSFSHEVNFAKIKGAAPVYSAATPARSLLSAWKPGHMSSTGVVTEVPIPGTISGFPARDAWVYLPPAYGASPRPLLPVLVLLAGQPGNPRDWLDGGQVNLMMDDFAAAHQGVAPVVVMPDNLGSRLANPLCMNSRLGQVQTYLTQDLPNWIDRNLQVQTDRRAWAVAGLSDGGTCALALAVRAPELFRTFVDISGQDEPTVGNRKDTIKAAFNGDEKAFAAVNPLSLMSAQQFPGTAGFIVVGKSDSVYRPEQLRVFAASQKAGMSVQFLELPGVHSWAVWKPGLESSLPWLAARIGITDPLVP